MRMVNARTDLLQIWTPLSDANASHGLPPKNLIRCLFPTSALSTLLVGSCFPVSRWLRHGLLNKPLRARKKEHDVGRKPGFGSSPVIARSCVERPAPKPNLPEDAPSGSPLGLGRGLGLHCGEQALPILRDAFLKLS